MTIIACIFLYLFFAKLYYDYSVLTSYEKDLKSITGYNGFIWSYEKDMLNIKYFLCSIFWIITFPFSLMSKITYKISFNKISNQS